jgi:fatty acid desaturase
VTNYRPHWSHYVIASHLVVFVVTGYALALTRSDLLRVILTIVSGTSLFVLTGLTHEATHHLLARPAWLNDLLGNLAGAVTYTPLSAYRARHLKHHQATNCEDDPDNVLNSRWMIAFGSSTYVFITHRYALRHLRGRALFRYAVEMAGISALWASLWLMPRAIREWSVYGPLIASVVLQNIRVVTAHLDLPSGKFHDTWQLVLPRWLSIWLLHYDHHLEHHLRPRLHWHELPGLRAKLAAEGRPELRRVTLPQFFFEVYLRRATTQKKIALTDDIGRTAVYHRSMAATE